MRNGLIQTLQDIIGHAGIAIISAAMGRMMYYSVRKEKVGYEILYELPIAIGFAFVGESIGVYLELQQSVVVGLIAVLSYIGPRGIDSTFKLLVDKFIGKTKSNDK